MKEHGSFVEDFRKKYVNSAIVKLYTLSGEEIKIKGNLSVKFADISTDYLTIKFDSHTTDIMISSIAKVEYYGGKYNDKS